jgi:hypothetical protein
MQLEIITGVSLFNNACQIVGIALVGQNDAKGACDWAQSVAVIRGRPAGVESLSGYSEADTIACLSAKWQEWANHNNLDITINRTPRRASNPF